MSVSIKKLFNEYGIGAIVVLLIVAYGVSLFVKYISSKGMVGYESNAVMPKQYRNVSQMNNNGVVPANPQGQNEVFASANGVQTSMPGIPSSCSQPNIQNPAELLPRDTNNEWAKLNPSGKGELANVNLLKAGYHIGIDSVGQTLRNANLQIRSEPPNPQLYVGPWNLSTIEPDYMRPPLELGSGPQ
uniref:Minor capsid protein P11 C-terminal conserved region domain-containing protein n=1 Tax=viral metagenome TaxID=1070528 RepID=A0A6C0DJR7_9ZZZZ